MNYSFVKVLFSTLLLVLSVCAGTAQDTVEDKEEANWIDKIKTKVNPYASLRVGFGIAEEGEIGISNNTPRIGIKVKHALSKNESDNFNVIGRVEFGLNLTSRDETVEFSIDAESGITQVGDAIFTRIGFLGLSYKDFQLTVGKQNSIYFNLAANELHHFSAFGGNATGVWNISDGGVSGTGRANQSMILSYEKGGLRIGTQAQVRNISENSKSIDTYGLAANYEIGGLGIGVAYYKVRDGVKEPLPNQAKDGDESFIAAASYNKNRLLIAVSYAVLKQHQKTSLNANTIFYDANGIEFIIRYKFSKNKRWHAAVGFSSLAPEDDQDLGDFTTNLGIAEIGYSFKKSSKVFIATKIDQSKNFTGNNRSQSVFGMGIRLDI